MLCTISPVFAGDERKIEIPVASPVRTLISPSAEDESLYRKVVLVFWSPRGLYESGQSDRPLFSEFAIAAPRLFFSADHEATSQKIIAAEFTKLLDNGRVNQVWTHCLSLRWIAAHIDLFAPLCKAAGEKSIGQDLPEPSDTPHISVMAEAESMAALNHYRDNPYDAERLKKLMALIRKDQLEALGALLKELVQLDEQYLWNRTKDSQSLANWTLYHIEKFLAKVR